MDRLLWHKTNTRQLDGLLMENIQFWDGNGIKSDSSQHPAVDYFLAF